MPEPTLLVALTTTIDPAAGSHGRPAVFLYANYIEVLERAGVTPVLITPAHSPAAIDALVSVSSGLVLTGGEDVDPALYGEAPIPALGEVQRTRDDMELRALACALRRELPVFGICRGAQVLNVHFGGTLFQDLNSQRPGDVAHQQKAPWGRDAHGARVEPDSLLGSIVGERRLVINSFHHQAVKDLGRNLRVVARAEDGLIEAIEHVGYPWLLGVQWHPERSETRTPDADPDLRLFAGFRDAVARHAATAAPHRPARKLPLKS
jgi:putative glutamine amidotransferase